MSDVFLRPALADQMAKQLLQPGGLDLGLRSGLFLSGIRRTGKTTFLLNDLIPALEKLGALVIYVDLWSDLQSSPAKLVQQAVRKALADLQTPQSRLFQKLKTVKGADFGAFGFKFGFKLENVGLEEGITLAEALSVVVDQAKTDVVLIIDEVQQAITREEGNQLLLALKAARDAINPRPDTPGHFVFIGTGSHRAMVSELTARRNQAFAGATSVEYPVLAQDYVQFLLQKLQADGFGPLPSLETSFRAFKMLGHRPEELLRAFRQLLLNTPGGLDPEQSFPVIAATLRATAADLELIKVEEMGTLAQAIFDRIAASGSEARGIFSADAAAEYSKSVGREVRVEEIQPVANELLAANLIMRRGHGIYAITDPFVQEIWKEKQVMLNC